MLSDQTDRILEFLNGLGLGTAEAQIYMYLAVNGPQSALSLSRSLKIGRTRVYRIMDTLKQTGLVRYDLGGAGLNFEAVDSSTIESILSQKQQELTELSASYQSLKDTFKKLSKVPEQIPKTVYFEGPRGLLNATWNTTTADGEGLRIWELDNMTSFIKYQVAEEIRREFVKREVYIRQLTNSSKLGKWTEVTELVDKYWRVRFLDPEIVKISFEIAIYNDTVTLYTFRKNTPYCVEIHDSALADMHRQIFDKFWTEAKNLVIRSSQGDARLA